MSAAPKYPDHLSYAGVRMTAQEFLALGETPERLELIDGIVTVSPKPSFRHQRVGFLIARAIDDWAGHHPGAHMAQDVSVQFGPSIVYEPDIVAFAPGTYDREPTTVDKAPDLIVEVSSPSTLRMDEATKKRDYERFGVNEYWLIDPFNGTARVFRRDGEKLVERAGLGTIIRSSALPGFTLDLARVLKST
jgi:Uma2 family endonuclease